MTLNNVMVQRGSSLGRRVDSLAQMPDSARLDLAAGLTRSRSPKMGSMWLDLSNSQAYSGVSINHSSLLDIRQAHHVRQPVAVFCSTSRPSSSFLAASSSFTLPVTHVCLKAMMKRSLLR